MGNTGVSNRAESAPAEPAVEAVRKDKRRVTKVLFATIATLGLAAVGGSFPDESTGPAMVAIIVAVVLAMVYLIYNVLALLFEVRKLKRFTLTGLLAILVCSFFFHWILMMFIDGASGANMYDTNSEDFAAQSLMYSLDQLFKGLTFDVMEGLRIDMVYVFRNWLGIEASMPEPTPNSSLAVFDAVYRTAITGISVAFLGNLLENVLTRS